MSAPLTHDPSPTHATVSTAPESALLGALTRCAVALERIADAVDFDDKPIASSLSMLTDAMWTTRTDSPLADQVARLAAAADSIAAEHGA